MYEKKRSIRRALWESCKLTGNCRVKGVGGVAKKDPQKDIMLSVGRMGHETTQPELCQRKLAKRTMKNKLLPRVIERVYPPSVRRISSWRMERAAELR